MGKLTVVRVNPSVVALQHHTLGPVGLLAVGTKEQPGTLVFYAQHPLWTMDTLRDVLAIMADCEVSTARAEEFRLATYEGKPRILPIQSILIMPFNPTRHFWRKALL